MKKNQFDPYFIKFAHNLDNDIVKLGKAKDDKELLNIQKEQLETLVKLERKFKTLLIKHKNGPISYKRFIHFICEERNNILTAKPYFRERQEVFTEFISDALKTKNHKKLYKFHFNYNFIQFILSYGKWGYNSELMKIVREIEKIRTEIAIMNMPLAISRARIFYSKTPRAHLSHMDLVQISAEGLLNAIDKFCLPFSKVFRGVIIGRIVGRFIESYCLDQDTLIQTVNGKNKKIKDFIPGDKVIGINNNGNIIETEVSALHDHKIVDGIEVTFDDGHSVVCSPDHKFLTKYGMLPIKDIILFNLEVLCEPKDK